MMTIIDFSKKEEEYVNIKLSKLDKNQEFARTVKDNEDLRKASDAKPLDSSVMLDKIDKHTRVETGHLFNPDKETDSIQQFNKRTFTQYKEQASPILRVRLYVPKKPIIPTSTC